MRTTFTNTASDRDFMNTIIKALQTDVPKKVLVEETQLNEKLDPDEEEEVNYSWDHTRADDVDNTIHKVFKGQSRIEYPLETSEEVPHPDVEEHLNNHGYTISDYVGGKAKDKYNRETNIGKALTKTNAPPQIKAAYDNDPTRQQKGKRLKVVISHRPTDVAGMTSGHQSWINHSCMNFKSGQYRWMLPHEVTAGTHVAYLTDMEDHDLERPVARIAAKPFRNDEQHLIFRPESKTYGNSNMSFAKSVNDWFENHYPAQENTMYEKDRHVYNDTEDTYNALSKDAATKQIEDGRKIVGSISPNTVNHIAHHLLTNAQSAPESLDKFGYGNHKIPFNRNQVNALYSTAARYGQKRMIKHLINSSGDVLNKKNLEHAVEFSNVSGFYHRNILSHRYLPDHIIDSLDSNDYEHVHPANIKDHHVDKVLDGLSDRKSGSAYVAGSLLPRYTTAQVKRYADINFDLKDYFSAVNLTIKHHPDNKEVSDYVFSKIKEIPDEHKKNEAMQHFTKAEPHPTTEHVAHANTIYSLNRIMENAKDGLTHNLALTKAINLKNEGKGGRGGRITLGENSDKFIDVGKHIPEIYDNLRHFDYGNSMSHHIHDHILHHIEHRIDKLQDEYDNADERESSKDDIENEIHNHFERHADMIEDKLSDITRNFRDEMPVNHREIDTLGDHIEHALNHAHNDGYSHSDAESSHRDLLREINRDY